MSNTPKNMPTLSPGAGGEASGVFDMSKALSVSALRPPGGAMNYNLLADDLYAHKLGYDAQKEKLAIRKYLEQNRCPADMLHMETERIYVERHRNDQTYAEKSAARAVRPEPQRNGYTITRDDARQVYTVEISISMWEAHEEPGARSEADAVMRAVQRQLSHIITAPPQAMGPDHIALSMNEEQLTYLAQAVAAYPNSMSQKGPMTETLIRALAMLTRRG